MYLEKILGSGTKINTLTALIRKPGARLIEKELAETAGASRSEVNRQLPDLVNAGLVQMERVGRSKVYTINQDHFLYPALKSLFRDLLDIYHEAAQKIADFADQHAPLEAVILFGSTAKGTVRSDITQESSDIDLLFITQHETDTAPLKDALIRFINTEIMDEYGFACYPIILHTEEYRNRLEDDQFIAEVHDTGETLIGEKPRRFG